MLCYDKCKYVIVNKIVKIRLSYVVYSHNIHDYDEMSQNNWIYIFSENKYYSIIDTLPSPIVKLQGLRYVTIKNMFWAVTHRGC